MYSLVSEPLGLAIKQGEKIKGIGVEGNREKDKIFQYVDDTTVIVKEMESVKKVMEFVQMFCKGSGGKVNEEKTVYIRFGGVTDLTNHFTFKETKEIKILGVLIGKDGKKSKGNHVGRHTRRYRKTTELLETEDS